MFLSAEVEPFGEISMSAMPRLPEPLTPESLRGLMRERAYWDTNHPRFPTYQRLVKRGFEILYPGTVRRDDTGMEINIPALPPEQVKHLVAETNREMDAADGGYGGKPDDAVHVVAHAREGGKIEVSDYWRAAPGQGVGNGSSGGADRLTHSVGTDGAENSGGAADDSRDPDNAEFLDRISKAEQSFGKLDDGYGEHNPESNELGRYQMKPNTLKGIEWRNPDGTWTEKARKYGVESDADFLKNPEAQEAAVKDMLGQYEKEAKTSGLYNHIGRTIEGKKAEIEVTEAGIIAAAHAGGAEGTRQYLNKIEAADYRSKDLPLTKNEERIETRFRIFQHVPYARVGKP